MDLEKINRTAIRAAYRAGRILSDQFGNVKQLPKKGAIDLVTEADLKSEQTIVATIREVYPDHAILAEEGGMSGDSRTERWIIDPLDGTTNYAHALPIYAVSIAFALQDEVVMGLVFNPSSGELFSASHGQGAQLNGEAIQVSSTDKLNESLLVTGFPYTVATHTPRTAIARFQRCLTSAQGVRRLGSAALDLCYVACGRFEGFWEENLKPWDTAAGKCILEEAGGLVSCFSGEPYRLEDQQILATNNHIHKDMVTLLTAEDD